MGDAFRWIKAYPLTALMILCCLVGGPYFGGQIIYEQYEAYTARILCEDVLASYTGQEQNDQTLFEINSRNTEEKKLAAEEKEAARLAEEERKKGPFTKVDQSYLDDALFIGDSRTDTLNLYAGWDNASYYVKTGTNIWSIMDEEVAPDPETGGNVSVDKALQKQQFGKIYIMLGVNELGTGTAETFYQQFKKVVERIRELQPEAVIFVESIIHVSASKDAEGSVINNKEINVRNEWLKKLADNETIFYLDANEVLDDASGALKEEYTFDGVHLKADQLDAWKNFFMEHGVIDKI
ncbi:MAG: GDSL-type esterase/lipase family protein [Coprococcus sp.]